VARKTSLGDLLGQRRYPLARCINSCIPCDLNINKDTRPQHQKQVHLHPPTLACTNENQVNHHDYPSPHHKENHFG
jgi:hypothetical protein